MNLFHDRTVTVEEESIGDLLKDLRDEAIILVKQQVELAKTETSEKISKLGKNSAYLFAGGAVLYAGLLFLLSAITLLGYVGFVAAGMASNTALWLAPLIMGIIVTIVGAVFVTKSIKTFKHTSVVPQKTVHSIKEDRRWITKNQR